MQIPNFTVSYQFGVFRSTARCLWSDILWIHHELLDPVRCRVSHREAAALTLIDWLVPWEKVVFFQRALITSYCIEKESELESLWFTFLQYIQTHKTQSLSLFVCWFVLIWKKEVTTHCVTSPSRDMNWPCRKETSLRKEVVQQISQLPLWLQWLPNCTKRV